MLRTQAEIEAVAKRAESYYHESIKSQLTEADKGRYIAIDADSGAWEIADGWEAVDHLRTRVPEADVHLIRHIDLWTVSIGWVPPGTSQ